MTQYEQQLEIKFRKKNPDILPHSINGGYRLAFVNFLIKECEKRDKKYYAVLDNYYSKNKNNQVNIYRVPKEFEHEMIRIPIVQSSLDRRRIFNNKTDGDSIPCPTIITADIKLYPVDFSTSKFWIGYDKKNNILAIQESESHIRKKASPVKS